ncbi:hypothetical protein V1511DRAFT_507211 [Dipodascopsis uninucleata]
MSLTRFCILIVSIVCGINVLECYPADTLLWVMFVNIVIYLILMDPGMILFASIGQILHPNMLRPI